MKNHPHNFIQLISLSQPTLKDNTADADRLVRTLKDQLEADVVEIDLELIRCLPQILRRSNFKVTCVLCKDRHRWIVTDIFNAKERKQTVGLAVDLGTTTIVLRMVDLSSGAQLEELSFINPQLAVGPDILTRILYADRHNGLAELNTLLISALNESIQQLCNRCNLRPENIYLLSVAGNTAMTHFFLRLNPHWLIREPYIPAVNSHGVLAAQALGINAHPRARVLIFPSVGSYFGGDLIAGIFFSGIHKSAETAILVDVGTNAEVVLGNKDWLIACAGAAGPALEGGVSQIGMLAGPGVIDRMNIESDSKTFHFHTTDGSAPKGICGSGLIELTAHLFLSGMIDIRGRFVQKNCGEKLQEVNGTPHLVIVPSNMSATGRDLGISQTDLESLIRSKAAMYTILETITAAVDVSFNDISTFFVSGTFGSFIKPHAAIAIGMLPDLPLSRYVPLGNSSIGGTTQTLSMGYCLEEIDTIRNRITYLELNVNQDFMNRFSAAKFLPHTDLSRFPSVKIHRAGQ